MSKVDPDVDVLHFQCKDIVCRDVIFKPEADIEEFDDDPKPRYSNDKTSHRRYQIQLFGNDVKGRSICLQVENYRPFFYIRFPEALAANATAFNKFERYILGYVPVDAIPLTSIVLEKHKTLFGFNNGEVSTFAKISVPSQALWRVLKDLFLTKDSEPRSHETSVLFGIAAIPVLQTSTDDSFVLDAEDGSAVRLKVYEANIDPVLRFFHIQGVNPAGWVQVDAGTWSFATSRDARVSLSAEADASDVIPGKDEGMAPYVVASWDIECTSSHGDFPIAKKTWRKPLREMIELGIVPETLEAFCRLMVEAITGTSTTLSRVYMKGAGVPAAETLQRILESHYYEEPAKFVDGRLKPAIKTTVRSDAAVLTALMTLRSGRGDVDLLVDTIDKCLAQAWPRVAGDEIIQIGTVLYRRGAAVSKHIWVLGPARGDVVDAGAVKPPGADVPIEVYPFRDEGLMLKAWMGWIGRIAPDVLIGYNIFGFDSRYVWDRLEETVPRGEIKMAVSPLSCCRTRPTQLEEKFLSSSAMGDNTMYFMSMPGRLQIDLLPYVRRNHILDSYTLDNVSATFMSGSIVGGVKGVEGTKDRFRFGTKSTKGIVVGRYITLMDAENDRVVDRCLVVGVEAKALVVLIEDGVTVLADHGVPPIRWSQVKDDVAPKDIFRLHRGSAKDRAIVARYCLQDCDLVMELFNKLEILNNSVAMAQVSWVPVNYIFLRGQGIKAESLIFKECRLVDQLIEVLPAPSRSTAMEDDKGGDADSEAAPEDDSYEGAIVLDPLTGVYDDPVTANDFSSLYPSSFISENISHDTKVSEIDYNDDGTVRCIRAGGSKYDNLPGQTYVDIQFDILRPDPLDTRKHPEKLKDGVRVARYIQSPQGTIPRILEMLLANRKKTRKLAESETDEFRKALLDAQQLAFKLTANSLYGQMGSPTFKVRDQTLAASCTAYGRKQLLFAKTVMEDAYGAGKDPRCDLECVYGDTDSIFLRFRPKDPATGKPLTGPAALAAAKALTIESGKLVSSCLKPPHDFEFDKIFKSFILLSKKRYVGDMSEDGLEDDDFHRKSMGIVMKRRDNAPIVKYVYGGAIERILNPTSNDVVVGVQEATRFVQEACRDLLAGKFPLTKLTITKSLRADYKDPTRIAHKVLADRIAVRDPGNKPSTSDRIPFVYVSSKGAAPKLQGDRIETPTYIKEKALSPDYAFYITNQIAKPVAQVFGLALEHMPGVRTTDLDACRRAKDPVAAREALAESILFSKILVDAARVPETMAAKGQVSIATFFKPRA